MQVKATPVRVQRQFRDVPVAIERESANAKSVPINGKKRMRAILGCRVDARTFGALGLRNY